MGNREITNHYLDGEIVGASPDSQYDRYNTSDKRRDLNYFSSKFLDLINAFNGTELTEVILNNNGGLISDSGGGQVDISELYGIGLAVDGAVRIVYMPQLLNVPLPTGWDDGRDIWVVAKHEYIITDGTRNHAKFPAQSYHYRLIDSHYGNANTDLLFVDSAPTSGELILGKFTMSGTTFTDLNVRSQENIFNNALINTIKLIYSGQSGSFIQTDANGSIILYSNAYLDKDGTTVRIYSTGRARRFRLELSQGYWDYSQAGLAGDAASFTTSPLLEPGRISSNLIFNTVALPPKISSGSIEVKGTRINNIADVALALSDALGVCSQSLADHSFSWIIIGIDENGNKVWFPSCDTQITVNTAAFSQINVLSGVATVLTADTTGLVAGMTAAPVGSSIGVLKGKITGVSAGVSFTMKTSAADGSYTGGTYSAYYRIVSNHITDSPNGINTDADIIKRTPRPQRCDARLGYYFDSNGLPATVAENAVYRGLGAAYIDGSGNVQIGTVISYKSGFDKNDNEIRADGYAGYGLTDTMVIYLTNYRRLWGDDYTAISNSTNGFICKIVTPNTYEFSFYSYIANTAQGFGITLNDTELTTSIQSTVNYQNVMQGEDGDGDGVSFSISRYFVKDDLLRVRSNGAAPLNTNLFGIGFRQVG